MGTQQNVQVVTDFIDAFNSRDWDRLRVLCGDSITIHDPSAPEAIRGKAAAVEMFQAFVDYFADGRIDIERNFGQGAWVCSMNRETGTAKVPPEGAQGEGAKPKSYSIPTCYAARVEEGAVQELHFFYDAQAMMTQLGSSEASEG